MLFMFGLAIVGVIALRFMTDDERRRLLGYAGSVLRAIVGVARRRRPELESFRASLRARTPIAIVTPAVLLSGVAMFVLMHFGSSTPDGPPVLLWGGSFGPRTTNGEWWRFATSMLIHPRTLLLAVNVAALLTAGPLVERYVGSVAFIIVCFMSGLIASATNLWWYPVAVSGGASGPIFGLYGLLLASFLWSRFRRASLEPDGAATEQLTTVMPPSAFVRTLPAAVAFVVSNMASDDLAIAAELAAFGVGFFGGLLITRRAFQTKPPVRDVGLIAVVAGAIVIALAFPIRGIADVKPEIESVVALEDRTAGMYQTAYERYKVGKVTGEKLAQQIDRTILPDLQAADERLKALQRVPKEHQGLVADAEEYLRLRIASWRLRAQALRKAGKIPERDAALTGVSEDAAWRVRAETQYRNTMAAFGSAEGAERASQEVLRRIRQ